VVSVQMQASESLYTSLVHKIKTLKPKLSSAYHFTSKRSLGC